MSYKWYESSAPKLTNFHIFIIPLPLNMALFSKSPYLTAHIKIKLWNRLHWKIFWKKKQKKQNRDVSRTIATSKTELFMVLVISFQPLTNFTKNLKRGTVGVLNAPVEYYNYNCKFVQVIKLSIAELYPATFLKIIYFTV